MQLQGCIFINKNYTNSLSNNPLIIYLQVYISGGMNAPPFVPIIDGRIDIIDLETKTISIMKAPNGSILNITEVKYSQCALGLEDLNLIVLLGGSERKRVKFNETV